jgi:hypothetical protein
MGLPNIPISLQNIYIAFSELFAPNSLAWQPPSTFSLLMILPLTLASFELEWLSTENAGEPYIYIWQVGSHPANSSDMMGGISI